MMPFLAVLLTLIRGWPTIPFAVLQDELTSTEISRVIERAEFDFYNTLMYKDQTTWVGRTISFRGSFIVRTDVTNAAKPYEQIRGSSNSGEPVEVIAFLDNPLKISEGIGDRGPTIVRGQPLRIFGIVQKCREVVARDGYVRILPTIELLLIYGPEDQSFSYPIWMSQSLKRH